MDSVWSHLVSSAAGLSWRVAWIWTQPTRANGSESPLCSTKASKDPACHTHRCRHRRFHRTPRWWTQAARPAWPTNCSTSRRWCRKRCGVITSPGPSTSPWTPFALICPWVWTLCSQKRWRKATRIKHETRGTFADWDGGLKNGQLKTFVPKYITKVNVDVRRILEAFLFWIAFFKASTVSLFIVSITGHQL